MRTLILLAVAIPLTAQSPVRLDRADGTFPEPFSNLIGLRELSDGRVIIADALEQSVARLDFRSGDMTLIGRQGNGPGEFGSPGQLFALPGDTTLMFDFANARGIVITPAGQMASNTISFASGEAGFALFPRAVDGQGRFYGTAPTQIGPGANTEMPDSTPVVRWSPSGGMDTVLSLPSSSSGIISFRISGGSASTQGRRQVWGRKDDWVLAPDGRIAVLHAAPYTLEWVDAAGRRTTGPDITYQPVRVTQRDKEEWAAGQSVGQMVVRTPEGSRTMRMPSPNLDEVDFPEFKPPFSGISATPEGEVWVLVHRPAGTTRELYDVFGVEGRRIRQVELAEGRRLVGFGRGTLYAVRKDEDDLQWLERYRR